MNLSDRYSRFIKNHREGVNQIGITILCLFMIFFSSSNGLKKTENAGLSIISQFQGGLSTVSGWISNSVNSISELNQLTKEYNELRDLLDSYSGIEREFVELRRENKVLKDLLAFSQTLDRKHIPAEIIARDPENLYDTFLINKGSIHGLKEEMPVIAYQNGLYGLVGRLDSVGINSSLVRPVTDRSSFVASRLQESRHEGLINGMGGENSNLIMKYVPKIALNDLNEGDLIVTSGLSSVYPKGIFIGRISEIVNNEFQPSLDLYINAVINFSRLEYVFVLTEIEGAEQ